MSDVNVQASSAGEFRPARLDRWRTAGLLCVVAVIWVAVIRSPEANRLLGFGPVGDFFDLRGSLAAGEAKARGLDPYVFNPLDPYGRPHLYSSWWLLSGTIGLTPSDTAWLGFVLVAGVMLAAMVAWPPRGWAEVALAGAILVSPAWLLAVYRANNDLVVFIALTGVLFAFSRPATASRVIGAGGIGALTVLKYFPAAGLVAVLAARTRREMLILLGCAAGVILVGWPSVMPALIAAAHHAPKTDGMTAFGASVLGGTVLADAAGPALWLLAACAGGIGFHFLARGNRTRPLPATGGEELRAMAAAVAAAVTVLSFASGSSYYYKLIFLWWLVPWLYRDGPVILGRRRAFLFLALLLAECWTDGLVLGFNNAFAPTWSMAQRMNGLLLLRTSAVATQLAYWVLMGACCGYVFSWSRQQLARLASAA
jgi:hypothetical protein